MSPHVCPWWVGYLLASPVRRLIEETRTTGDVTIRLLKRIPLGSGMAGGSSDAAAALVVEDQPGQVGGTGRVARGEAPYRMRGPISSL